MEKEEKVWAGIVIAILSIFLITIAYGIVTGINTPNEGKKITKEEIEKFKSGVFEIEKNVYEVRIIAKMWSFDPFEIVLKNPKKIIFKIVSEDVIHGFTIVNTNVNVMIIPGYITTITYEPPEDLKGELLFICSEYCGSGHHRMYGKLIIER